MTDAVSGPALLDVLAQPAGVIVVGGGGDPTRVSGRPLRYLRDYGYAGPITVVTRRAAPAGVQTVPAIDQAEIGTGYAAIVSLPAPAVAEAVAQLDAAGVAACVVIGSGFEEPGSQPRQDLLRTLADRTSGMRLIGPNCVGSMSVASASYLTFSSVLAQAPPRCGGVGLVTQSGALGNGLLMSLARRGVGIAHWVSTGDELDTGAVELTAAMLVRPEVRCVGLYLEGLTDPSWLLPLAQAIRRTGKNVFVLKAARSAAGQAAAGGHTGRVVGSHAIASEVLRQAGLREVDTVAELADCLVVNDICGMITPGARVAIVSVSGASGVIGADGVAGSSSLRLSDLSEDDAGSLGLDPRLHATNPLDVPFLGETQVFLDTIESFRRQNSVDVVVAVNSTLAHDRAALVAGLVGTTDDVTSPVVVCHLSEDDAMTTAQHEQLAMARVAVVPTVDRAIAALARVAPKAGESPPPPDEREAAAPLGLEAIGRLVPGVDWAQWTIADSLAEATRAAEEWGYPVVVKAAGRTIVHRSEIGAVAKAASREELGSAWRHVSQICHRHGDVALVQAFAPAGGLELMVAALRHPELGPVVVIRPGGVLTELMQGEAILAGLWDRDTRRSVFADSSIATWLAGYRGAAPSDVDSVLELSETLLAVMLNEEGLRFLEFNPVIVYPTGLRIVDATGGLTSGQETGGRSG